MEHQIPFAESCLPSTIALAKRNKARILPQLDKATKAFPFEDRVLIWLHAIWQEDIERFHRSNGQGMAKAFETHPHKLRRFDEHYRQSLEERLKL